MKKALVFISAAVLILTITLFGAIFITDRIINEKFAPEIAEQQERLKTLTPAILADLKILSEQSPFKNLERKNNADAFLADNLKRIPKEVDVFFKNHQGWMTDKQKFDAMMADTTLPVMDTTWVDLLQNFDHWNFMQSPEVLSALKPLPNMIAVEKIEVWSNLPFPQVELLSQAAYLRFVFLYKSGKPYDAFKILRKAAELENSTEILLGHMQAMHLLNVEASLAQFITTDPVWTPVAEATRAAYRRTSWAWGGIMQNAFLGYYNSDFDKYLKSETGVCTGVYESLYTYMLQKEFLASGGLFEKSWRSEMKNGLAVLQKTRGACPLDDFNPFFSETPPEASSRWVIPVINRETNKVEDTIINLARIPFLRRIYGMILISVNRSYLKLYESKNKSTAATEALVSESDI